MIYTFTGTGSGSFGADQFSDASFSITSIADTGNIQETSGIFKVPDSVATVWVSGLGSATFTVPTINVGNTVVGRVGISGSIMAILFNGDPAFASYDLSSPIGPVTGIPIFNPGLGFSTTSGNFLFTSVSSVTFQAEVVPEPSVVALLGVGFVGLAFRYQSRRKHRLRRIANSQ
jgi:hypothetical protein